MKRYADIYRPLSIRRRKVVCSPCGVADKKCSLLVCIKSTCLQRFASGNTSRTHIPMSTCCSLKMRSSSYHMPGIGFRYPSLAHAANKRNGTSGNYRARITRVRGRESTSKQMAYRAGNERYLFLPAIELPCLESLVGYKHDRVSETDATSRQNERQCGPGRKRP